MGDCMSDQWAYFGRVAALTLTVFGIITVPFQIYRLTQSMIIAITGTIIIILVFGFAAFRYFFPSVGHWRAGYRRFSTQPIVTKRTSTIAIDDKFRATIDRRNELVFFDPPTKDDLVDMIDTLPGEHIDERLYSSTDSTIDDVRHTNPHNLVVYWKPKHGIKPYVPYAHQNVHVSPSLYGDDFFYHSIYIDRHVGISDLEVRTKHRVEDSIAFVMPVGASQITEKRLFKYGYSGRRRGCEQPVVDLDGFHVAWHIENPKLGRVYVLLGFFENQSTKWAELTRKQFLSYRILDALGKVGRALHMFDGRIG